VVSFIGGGNGSIKRYETSISNFMSHITIEIYTMFLLIHVVEQMWAVPGNGNIGESGVKHHPPPYT
jgi:preprotein translocase subunit SecG